MAGYKEADSLGGHDPYSASKAGAEIVTQSYYQSFFQPSNHSSSQSYISPRTGKSVSSARAGNVIGGGDWSLHRLLPDCIRSLEQNKPVIIRNPDAIRPWQHVLEPLNGYLHLAFRMSEDPAKYSGAWNFGPEEDGLLSVRDLVENILAYWGKGTWKEELNINKPHETAILKLNINKAKHILGWKPTLDFKETIGMTVKWYKNYSDTDVYQLCCEQINDFSLRWNSGKKK